MRALHRRCCHSCELPAVCSLGRQDVGEEHLRQLPEVEELISAAAQGYVEVGTVFLQSSLLKVLCELYYREQQGGKGVSLFMVDIKKRSRWVTHVSTTFLPGFAYDFNMLHGNFKKLLCDEGCHIHLGRENNVFKKKFCESTSKDLDGIRFSFLPSGFVALTQLRRNAKSLSARQQRPHHRWCLWNRKIITVTSVPHIKLIFTALVCIRTEN